MSAIAITGTSRGIGYALAEHLSQRGYTVLAGARNIETLKDLPLRAQVLDVTQAEQVAAFAHTARSLNTRVLINNAGVGVFKPVEHLTEQDYRYVMDTNVLGLMLCCKAFIPILQKHKAAQIINITSDVSGRTFASGALYSASKYAGRAISQALAKELRPHIRVTEIRPGMVDTYFANTQQGDEHKQAWLKPSDVVQAVEYALNAPEHVRIDEILLHPVVQDVEF